MVISLTLDLLLLQGEMINCIKKSSVGVVFKVDNKKDFDFMTWNFLNRVFLNMGFDVKMRVWIKYYIYTVYLFVTVNKPATMHFPMKRGFR